MGTLVVIPARGGSKGVPNKNIKLLNDVPLIKYTIDTALEIFGRHEIYISTDSPEIKRYVESCGIDVPFLRPAELALDHSSSYDVLLHALDFYLNSQGNEPDTIVLLQPTSPFRTSSQLSQALELYRASSDIDMVVSVKGAKSNPYFNLFEEDENGFLLKSKRQIDVHARQAAPKVWEFNGAIYIINVASLKKSKLSEFTRVLKFEMDEVSSHDIDTMFDWEVAELIVAKKSSND